MTKKEEFEKHCGVRCFRNKDYQGFVWSWIEEQIKQAKIEENKRNIEMFMHYPDSEFTDLGIKIILSNRISELEKEKI